MEFNVAQLLKQLTGATREYELEENFEGIDPGIVPLSPLTGRLKLLRTHSGVLAIGDLNIRLEVVCNRCLEPVELPVSVQFEESFRPLTHVDTGRFIMPQEFKGQEEELTDAALIIDDHHILDIAEVVRQNIWLSMPMYPGCIWSDPDNCPNFVEQIQEIEEVHPDLVDQTTPDKEAIDPRWAALLALRNQNEDESSG